MELVFDDADNVEQCISTAQGLAWAHIESAIRALDGIRHTDLVLDDGDQLTIGGGNGRYVVSMFTADERGLVLADDSRRHLPRELLIAGGQKISLPAERVVSLSAALSAAREFFFKDKQSLEQVHWIVD